VWIYHDNTGEAPKVVSVQGEDMADPVRLHYGHKASIVDLATDNTICIH